VRLAKLLRIERADTGRLDEYLRETIQQAIRVVTE
jgi:hypothetical protein